MHEMTAGLLEPLGPRHEREAGMRFIKTATGFVVRLDRGEEVLDGLSSFIEQAGLVGGSITGIGAVQDTVLGYLDPETKSYHKQTFSGDMELVNLTGNITWVDGKPFVHAHVTISGSDFVARSGHLFQARIAVTGEFYVHPSEVRLARVADPVTGANLISD